MNSIKLESPVQNPAARPKIQPDHHAQVHRAEVSGCPAHRSIHQHQHSRTFHILYHVLELAVFRVRLLQLLSDSRDGFEKTQQITAFHRIVHVLHQCIAGGNGDQRGWEMKQKSCATLITASVVTVPSAASTRAPIAGPRPALSMSGHAQ